MGGIDQSIGPGLGGFLAFFLLAMALWLLMRNMSKHLRNVAYMQEREDEQEGRGRAAGAAAGSGQRRERDGADVDGADVDHANDDAGADDSDEVQTRPSSLAAGYPAEEAKKPRSGERD